MPQRSMLMDGLRARLRPIHFFYGRCERQPTAGLLWLFAVQGTWFLAGGRLEAPRPDLCPEEDFLFDFTSLFLRGRSDAADALVVSLPQHRGSNVTALAGDSSCPAVLRRLINENARNHENIIC
ncbi:uncharacterized protein LOC117642919 [Thrips palmi]|uniref:Uncharacterized protein LOC117642919 n=1 Tax=Thrips palmi TaxID=161013 RepID=A0A6P8YCP5_THRPL|nr:uncharacterized protein LOC117642919 [Thrips palmi]